MHGATVSSSLNVTVCMHGRNAPHSKYVILVVVARRLASAFVDLLSLSLRMHVVCLLDKQSLRAI